MQEESLEHSHHHADDPREKIKYPLAISLLVSGIIMFLITLSGITDGLSEWTTDFLIENLGYTNRWSQTYGPDWFYQFNKEIASLGGGVFMSIAVTFIAGFYYKNKDKRRMWRFLIIIVGGLFFTILMKTLFAYDIPSEDPDTFITTVSTYPSGHAMMATIFYLTSAVYLTRKSRGTKIRQYYIIAAIIVIFIIGLSRIFGANHTPTEVIAGWSLGLVWLCICWLLERFAKTKGW